MDINRNGCTSTPEVNNPTEVHDTPTVVDDPKAPEPIPELVRSSPSPVKKKTKKASEASNNAILAEILQELREIKAMLKDKQ